MFLELVNVLDNNVSYIALLISSFGIKVLQSIQKHSASSVANRQVAGTRTEGRAMHVMQGGL